MLCLLPWLLLLYVPYIVYCLSDSFHTTKHTWLCSLRMLLHVNIHLQCLFGYASALFIHKKEENCLMENATTQTPRWSKKRTEHCRRIDQRVVNTNEEKRMMKNNKMHSLHFALFISSPFAFISNQKTRPHENRILLSMNKPQNMKLHNIFT